MLPRDLFSELKQNISKSKQFISIFINQNSTIDEEIEESQQHFQLNKPRSILEGIPISIKDNFCTIGMKTTCGSKILQGKSFILIFRIPT